jgi:hypothetical protein
MNDGKKIDLLNKLTELDLFSESELEMFSRYGITTLEQLLGATKGLTHVRIFDSFEQGERKLFKIREVVGEYELKKFIDFKSDYPTGLIIDDHE